MTKNNFNNERLLFSDPLILGFEGNILKINGNKVLFNIQNNDQVSDILKPYNVSILEEKISKLLKNLSELDEGKNIPFLHCVTFYSSKNSNILIASIEPSVELSKEQLVKMIEEFLDKFLTEYLFSKNNTNYNNSIIFFENQHLEYSIPINQLTSKPLKF